MVYKYKIVVLFVVLPFLMASCSDKKCKFAAIKEKLDIETISKAVQIFVVDTLSVSSIIVVDNVDSLEYYDKYILFYDRQNELLDYVYTETIIDSVNRGCVYFTDSMQNRRSAGKCAWPDVIPKKSFPYVHQSITTYDVGIVKDYYFMNSSICFIFNAYNKPMPKEVFERKATMFYKDTDEYVRTDTLSSRISDILFDYSSIELTPNDRLKRLRFRRVSIKQNSFIVRLTIHEDIEDKLNEDLFNWITKKGDE